MIKIHVLKQSEMRSEGRRINILDSVFSPLCKEPYQRAVVSDFFSGSSH